MGASPIFAIMNVTASLSRRRFLMATAAAAALPAAARAGAASPVVVELFTSQGCSSCPPADAYLSELCQRPGVVALTYHVDYWDYLGWHDTLGSAENSQRQYDYAKARGDMDVYTPQMIVHGAKHFVGSNRSDIDAAVAGASPTKPVPIALSVTGTEVAIDVGQAVSPAETTFWLLPVTTATKVKILKGEIAGQEISYRNVVRKIIPAGMWHGEAQRFALPHDAVFTADVDAAVVLLQEDKVGAILGCATWGAISV